METTPDVRKLQRALQPGWQGWVDFGGFGVGVSLGFLEFGVSVWAFVGCLLVFC